MRKKYIPIAILIFTTVWVFWFQFEKKTAQNIFDEPIIVEKYIRENIKILAPEKPVLGGSWYVVSVEIDPVKKTGIVVYEDGHIQGKASFNYSRKKGEVIVDLVEKR